MFTHTMRIAALSIAIVAGLAAQGAQNCSGDCDSLVSKATKATQDLS